MTISQIMNKTQRVQWCQKKSIASVSTSIQLNLLGLVFKIQRRVRINLLNLFSGSCHKRQKPQAPTPQAPIRYRQTRKVANAKGLSRNTNLT